MARCADRRSLGVVTALLLDVSPDIHSGDPTGIDISVIVYSDTFWRAGLRRRMWNEGRDLAVLRAADADTSVEPGIVGRIRLRVGHVDRVVLVDSDVARAAELFPFGDKFPVRQAASKELEKVGHQVQDAIENALERKLSLETRRRLEQILNSVTDNPSPETQQAIRAIMVLERISSLEA